MSKTNLKSHTLDELHQQLNIAKANYSSMRLSHGVSPIANYASIRLARHSIARYLTEITSRK